MGKLLPAILLLCVALALVGCQQTATSVDSLPPPTFNPPAIARADVPRVPPGNRAVSPAQAGRAALRPAVSSGPRDWAPRVKANSWRWIVIHHSATPSGGAAAFDKMHRAKGWDELGYHFVIGNGTDTRDGVIEVGSRWPVQKWGAHTKTPDNQYNNFGIGICLVGNFEIDRPTPAQVKSLVTLVSYLQKTYRISSDHVIGHKNAKPTECPGSHTDLAAIRRMAAQQLAADAEELPPDAVRTAADKDLLYDAGD